MIKNRKTLMFSKQSSVQVLKNNFLYICCATGIEEDPKVAQDTRCLRRGGGVVLIQTKQQFPQPKR